MGVPSFRMYQSVKEIRRRTVRLTDRYFFFLLSVDGALRFEFDMVKTSLSQQECCKVAALGFHVIKLILSD